jgi:hypothetical protein
MKTKIRSSALPKLAACGQYEGTSGEASEAAQRGLRLDAALRDAWHTGKVPPLEREEGIAVAWAYGVIDGNANAVMYDEAQKKAVNIRHDVEMREENCKIWVPIIDYTGTADAICVEGRWIADLKSGQVRNYREQMAAYCLGLMVKYLELQWTYHLVFCDAEEVVSETLTFEQARDIVRGVVDNVGTDPRPCDYCQWCAKAMSCPPRVAAQAAALETTETPGFWVVLNNPDKLGEFLSRAKVFDEFREAAKDRARKLLESGQRVPGWRLQKPRVSETLDAGAQLASGIPLEALISAHGPISAAKARKLGVIDENLVTHKESRPILSQL